MENSPISEKIIPCINSGRAVGLLSTQSAKNICSQAVTLPPTSIPAALTFSPEEDIDYAFSKLSSGIKTMIENSGCKFNILQDACLEKALSPKACISGEIVPKIEQVNSFQALCTTLTIAQHWNFLDTRMMEAMVTASMIPTAHETLQNFKKTFYGMKLSEVVPFIPVIPLKPSHISITEQIDVDPRQYTIAELHKHRFYLETELGSGTLTCYKIMVGSLFIVWQVHVDHAYNAYLTLSKKRSCPLLGCVFTIPALEKWAKLPVILRGQEVGQVGPIEQPLKDRAREDPFLLPEGLEWTWLNSKDVAETFECKKANKWYIHHPQYDHTHAVGISSKYVKCTFGSSVPHSISIRGCDFSASCVELYPELYPEINDQMSLITSELLKEMLGKTKKSGISQLLVGTMVPFILKPVVIFTCWVYPFSNFWYTIPYDTPKTNGLRRISPEDIPEALNLVNCYGSKFEISQVFKSEEEFSHYFLCLSVPGCVVTYVVEDPTTHNITDMFTFQLRDDNNEKDAIVTAIVVTKSPPRQFVTDLLVCAKLEKVSKIYTTQYGLAKSTFENLFIEGVWNQYLHFYNYAYPEIAESKCCLFSL
ncbi:glycylpeptide N-tetradecanoyltransferase-like isoform X2 [Dysidea avara]|uniref:glycylpeptide N-tetradecanoyltransferase-like isoform X2 n=1 Tax=Dysidea avara TaxID=196820 RepID=UPI003319A5C1